MAFGAEELRVLRRALALALHPGTASAEDVQDCFRLADSVDEALDEAARLRAFLLADLGRYRAALPGTAAGYLALLQEALGAGHRPVPDDLAALRALRGNPVAAALLAHCQGLVERSVRARYAAGAPTVPAPAAPPSRARLLALPGGAGESRPTGADESGEAAQKPAEEPARPPAPRPGERPAAPAAPKRPVPTPGEVFPRRKPQSPPSGQDRSHHLAAG
ncbi:hypothetical protein [Streptomyces sp. NBC_00566]|uniref:hypothetical protein n=1 Tax=Streptomyces sp. NBC_00566 TaxID=2975778 RepID=UPI002E80D0BF|nr:hypothetical protein [Streptomyces sp. NBC_00566]WUB90682.1 hypothetical protein OG812_13275 [Streptomyces sp. NBC_00566]